MGKVAEKGRHARTASEEGGNGKIGQHRCMEVLGRSVRLVGVAIITSAEVRGSRKHLALV